MLKKNMPALHKTQTESVLEGLMDSVNRDAPHGVSEKSLPQTGLVGIFNKLRGDGLVRWILQRGRPSDGELLSAFFDGQTSVGTSRRLMRDLFNLDHNAQQIRDKKWYTRLPLARYVRGVWRKRAQVLRERWHRYAALREAVRNSHQYEESEEQNRLVVADAMMQIRVQLENPNLAPRLTPVEAEGIHHDGWRGLFQYMPTIAWSTMVGGAAGFALMGLFWFGQGNFATPGWSTPFDNLATAQQGLRASVVSSLPDLHDHDQFHKVVQTQDKEHEFLASSAYDPKHHELTAEEWRRYVDVYLLGEAGLAQQSLSPLNQRVAVEGQGN